MKVFDKVSWHIDGGENINNVIKRFNEIMIFLKEKNLLNSNGIELIDIIDSNLSINDSMLTKEGIEFFNEKYDLVIQKEPQNVYKNLSIAYEDFLISKSL